MFYMLCDDPTSLDTLITCSALDARLFMSKHPNAWVFKYSDDGQLTSISMVEDF